MEDNMIILNNLYCEEVEDDDVGEAKRTDDSGRRAAVL